MKRGRDPGSRFPPITVQNKTENVSSTFNSAMMMNDDDDAQSSSSCVVKELSSIELRVILLFS